MPRPGLRPPALLLAFVVAALGLLGVAARDGLAPDGPTDSAQQTASPHDGAEGSLLAPDTPAIVQVTADHLRSSVRHGAPVVTLAAVALAGLLLVPVGAVARLRVPIRRARLVHVRRRGPPVVAVT